MKKIIFILLYTLVFLTVKCQTAEKVNYKLTEWGTYVVTFDSQWPIHNVLWRYLDEQWLINNYVSIIENSISPEQLQHGGRIHICYSLAGEALSLMMNISGEHKDILGEDVLVTLYKNFKKFKVDMSKIEIIYPENWVPGTTEVWMISFPLSIKRK